MGSRPRVYITTCIPPAGRALLEACCDVTVYDGAHGMKIPRGDLLTAVVGIDALFVTSHVRVDAELFDAAGPSLRVVATMSVGLEHIDRQECARRSIPVGYTPDVLTAAVAEHAIGLTLATARRFKEGLQAVRDGVWLSPTDALHLFGSELRGSTVGIVGLGRIGLAVARRLLPFEIKQVIYSGHAPKDHASEVGAKFVSFDELLANSDYVICCCPLNPGNIGLFDAAAFGKMKKNAILINMARGGLVNQEDLYAALKSGQILAAGLDCTTPEPLPPDSPLLTLTNCTVVPHIGSATITTRNNMATLTARNILAGLNGEPLITPVPM